MGFDYRSQTQYSTRLQIQLDTSYFYNHYTINLVILLA